MESTTCGLKESYIKAYMGNDYSKAQSKAWKSCEKRKNICFNGFAFLFSYLWCFKKRMYREFAVILAISVILPVIVGGLAGISRMEGEITPQTVYSELRKIPLVIDKRQVSRTCVPAWVPAGPETIEQLADHTPWYKLMLIPFFEARRYDLELNVHFEPAFYFALYRMITIFFIHLFCGLYFDYMYFRSTRRNILRELANMRSDDEQSRPDILAHSGRENREMSEAALTAFVFAVMCAVLPVFYDAICIVYNY